MLAKNGAKIQKTVNNQQFRKNKDIKTFNNEFL